MKSMKAHPLQFLSLSNPSKSTTISPFLHQLFASFSSSIETPKLATNSEVLTTLTQEEVTRINLLIPRLCLLNHLTTAIQLTTTTLLTNPPPKSLSFSVLVHSLTSQPDMIKPISLLTILRHTPIAHSHLTPITIMLITSYIKKKRPKEALKVYHWILRPGSPCKVEKIVFSVLVNGFCEFGWVLEGLKVLRDMVSVGFLPIGGLKERVYRSLLREARVREAVELDKALCDCFEDVGGESCKEVIDLLDSLIRNWSELRAGML
ncbi:unnamed protein product [Dovyalis caffra]|uniref:Pentatricopeptide repeat-containing protein n=1 Tax=Dovyalis caffra TaxID=77055 RepID=A0AAV1RGQ1_9ROSI|nr:unnamed protein product [Dovyalis caffra]